MKCIKIINYLECYDSSVTVFVEYFVNEVSFGVQGLVEAVGPVGVQGVGVGVRGHGIDVGGGGGERRRQGYDGAGRKHGRD